MIVAYTVDTVGRDCLATPKFQCVVRQRLNIADAESISVIGMACTYCVVVFYCVLQNVSYKCSPQNIGIGGITAQSIAVNHNWAQRTLQKVNVRTHGNPGNAIGCIKRGGELATDAIAI